MIKSYAPVWQILSFGAALAIMGAFRVHGDMLKRALRREAMKGTDMTGRP